MQPENYSTDLQYDTSLWGTAKQSVEILPGHDPSRHKTDWMITIIAGQGEILGYFESASFVVWLPRLPYTAVKKATAPLADLSH